MTKPLNTALGCVILASAALVSLNNIPRPLAVAIGITLLFATGWMKGWPVCAAAIVLFGLPFLAALGSLVGLSPTSMVIASTLVMSIYVLKTLLADGAERQARSNTAKFVIWWIVFQAIYVVQYLLGPNSDHSMFMLQYLLVYGNFNAVGAIIVAQKRPTVSDVLSIGTLFFVFYFPMLGISILGVSSLADSSIGLRAMDGFNSIGAARMSGLLTIFAICTYIFSADRLKKSPYIAVALAVSAPLTFYSYTRQVYVAIVLSAMMAFVYKIFKGRDAEKDKYQFLALISLLAFSAVGFYKLASMLMGTKGNRVVEGGIEINRLGLWGETWELILDNPIMGLGVGGFQQHSSALWPHNWILEAWVELGIVGLAVAVLPILAIGKSLFGRFRERDSSWIFLGVYYLIVIQVSGDIPRNMEFLFFAGLMICMSSIQVEERHIADSRKIQKAKINFSYV